VIWANSALDDLQAVHGYYINEVRNEPAAIAVTSAIVTAGDTLDLLPFRGQHQSDGTYAFPVLAYPQYRLIYDVDAAVQQVEILHVETTRTATPRPVALK
jgi:plasmid stabilization system protein ParE